MQFAARQNLGIGSIFTWLSRLTLLVDTYPIDVHQLRKPRVFGWRPGRFSANGNVEKQEEFMLELRKFFVFNRCCRKLNTINEPGYSIRIPDQLKYVKSIRKPALIQSERNRTHVGMSTRLAGIVDIGLDNTIVS